MFCIAAFIVFGIISMFSVSYRPLAAKGWYCVMRRITFKPCDINFADEVKGRLVGKYVITHPRFARLINRWIDWLAFIFVVLSIWSVVYVLNAGLNLWVYDTCDPRNVESCSLSGDACGIDQTSINFRTALTENKIGTWMANPFVQFFSTISRIPDRLRYWNPADYFSSTVTTYFPIDATKPYALEVLDPGCKYCRILYQNIKAAGLEQSHNLSYLLYPIPNTTEGTYKFSHSMTIASYIEATKLVPLQNNPTHVAPDWQLIEKVFSKKLDDSIDWQTYFNMVATVDDVHKTMKAFLTEIGYSTTEIDRIVDFAQSDRVAKLLAEQKTIVETQLRTLKIPTILFNGRRYDRVIDAKKMKAS